MPKLSYGFTLPWAGPAKATQLANATQSAATLVSQSTPDKVLKKSRVEGSERVEIGEMPDQTKRKLDFENFEDWGLESCV